MAGFYPHAKEAVGPLIKKMPNMGGPLLKLAGLDELLEPFATTELDAIFSMSDDEIDEAAEGAGLKRNVRKELLRVVRDRRSLQELLEKHNLTAFREKLLHLTLPQLLSQPPEALDDLAEDAGLKKGDRRAFVLAVQAAAADEALRVPLGGSELLRSAGLDPSLKPFASMTLKAILAMGHDELEDLAEDAGLKSTDRRKLLKMIRENTPPTADTGLRELLEKAGLEAFLAPLSAFSLFDLLGKTDHELEDLAEEIGLRKESRRAFLRAIHDEHDQQSDRMP